jgi:hypothetical protein
MDNEVVIPVRSDNQTKAGFDAARRDADNFGKDVTKTLMGAGVSGGGAFAKSISTQVAGLSGSLGPVLGAVGVAAAPFLASAVSGAIIGGAGIGGVVGGLMVVKDDPRVAGAIKGLTDNLEDRLDKAAGSFVEPAIKGVGIIKSSLDTIDIEGIFDKSAEFVVPLAEGVGRAIEGLGNGIEDLVDNAGPAIDSIADGIGDVGEALGDGLSSLSDNGESAASALDDIFFAMELIADSSFGTINGLMEINEQLEKIGLGADDSLLSNINKIFSDNEVVVGEWVDGIRDGTDAMTDFQKAIQEVNDELRAQADPVFALMDAIDDLAKGSKAYDEAVKEHGKNSREAKAALREQAGAALDLQEAVGQLGDDFDGNLTPAMRATLEAAGFTKTEMNRLEKQFREARKEAKDFDGTYRARVSAPGLNGVITDLYEARRIANSLDGKTIDIAMRVTGVGNVSKARHAVQKQYADGGIKGAADGGNNSGLTWVGEAGPELVDLPPGAQVHTTGDSMRMSGGGSGGGGFSGTIVNQIVLDGLVLAEQMLDPQRDLVRTQFGGDVQAAYGRN